jgi:hypothetical protein
MFIIILAMGFIFFNIGTAITRSQGYDYYNTTKNMCWRRKKR